MFTMNVPKFLWGEAIKTAAYLINRMPLRGLDYKTPAEYLLKTNDFVVSPKVFGCVCFVHDYRNSVGKLDPRAIKCVFVGYSPSQKGYRCWCPSERRFFVSMDVTFRENEPYYGPADDTGITLSPPEVEQEGESNSGGNLEGSIVVPTLDVPSIDNNTPSQGEETHNNRGAKDNNSSQGDMQDITANSSPPTQDLEPSMHEDPGTNLHSLSPVAPTSTIGQAIPTNWKEAKEDPKWKDAMLDEMRALEKNKTWELVDLPQGKQPVCCKWVFTIKHTPEGKVDR